MNNVLVTILLLSPIVIALVLKLYIVSIAYVVFVLILAFSVAVIIARRNKIDKNKLTTLYITNISFDKNIPVTNDKDEIEKYSVQ